MRATLASLSILAVASLACGADPPALLRLDVPVTVNDRALIVVVEHVGGAESGKIEARAIAIDDHGGFEAVAETLPSDAKLVVSALLYRATLAELSLAPGPLELAPAGSPSLPLPPAAALYSAEVVPSAAPTWTPSDAPRRAVAELALPASASCASFSARAIALDSTADARFVTKVKPGGVLVGTSDRELFYVEKTGAVRVIGPTRRDGSQAEWYAAYVEDGSTIWLAGELGGIWRGDLLPARCDAASDPCTKLEAGEVSIVTAVDDVGSLSGPPHGRSNVQYALTKQGAIERFDGSLWSRIYDLSGSPGSTFLGRVVYLGDDEAVAVSERQPLVARYRRGTLTDEPLPAEVPASGLITIADVPRYGLLAGSALGAVVANDGTGWRLLATKSSPAPIRAIAPYGLGWVLVDEDGVFAEHVPGTGFCPPLAPPAIMANRAHHLAVVGDDVVLVGDFVGGEEKLFVRWLERQ